MICPNGCGADLTGRTVAHGCFGPPTDTDPVAYREQQRDDAVRQLAMLRVTLAEWRERALANADDYQNEPEHERYWLGRCHAFSLVLSLLGPEETYVDDETEPF